MLILRSIRELHAWRSSLDPTMTVGFVPTMGALHSGHMKLVEEGHAASDVVVVSIFVNPLQFGPSEDLARYPRPFERDVSLCETAGASVVFAPAVEDFYGKDHATTVDVKGLDAHLCGAARPGHFSGVCTVVLKLFHLVKPHRAWFGKKDIQQALILKRMVLDLSLDVEMILTETVREPSGLALSSRNTYLTEDERERASALHHGLSLANAAFAAGERNADVLKGLARRAIEASGPSRIDYVELVSQARLAPIATVDRPAVLAVAVFYGKTRLIDNVLLE